VGDDFWLSFRKSNGVYLFVEIWVTYFSERIFRYETAHWKAIFNPGILFLQMRSVYYRFPCSKLFGALSHYLFKV